MFQLHARIPACMGMTEFKDLRWGFDWFRLRLPGLGIHMAACYVFQMIRSLVFAFSLSVLLCSCEEKYGPQKNQSLGRATGFFATLPVDRAICELGQIVTPSLDPLFVPENPDQDTFQLALAPIAQADRRFITTTSLSYGHGDETPVVIEYERGHRVLDYDLQGSDIPEIKNSGTSLYFPLFIHNLRAEAKRLCNASVTTGERSTTDCVDFPESTMRDAYLWCGVGVLAPKEFSE
jgi:hypothetical protein